MPLISHVYAGLLAPLISVVSVVSMPPSSAAVVASSTSRGRLACSACAQERTPLEVLATLVVFILVSISLFSYAVSFSVVGIGFYPAAAALVAPPTSGRMAFSCSVVYVPDTHMCIYMLYLPFANQSYAISGSYASV